MAGSGIERTSRPVPSGSPALMPPHIQGAEQRTVRRTRWSLRILVIGGLTGAAWLLTGAAAHAADRNAEPGGTPTGSVVISVPLNPGTTRTADPGPADPVVEHPVVQRPGDDRPVGAGLPRAHQAFRAGRTIKPGRTIKHSKAAHRRPAVASATADGPVPDRRDTPRGDGPGDPLRPYLGDSGGNAATGPTTPLEGGCAAFLPATIADSTMACHPPAIATDSGARRHDAEAPTVSPD